MNKELEAEIFLIEPSMIDFWLVSEHEAFAWFSNPLTAEQITQLRELGMQFEPLAGPLQGRYRITPAA